MKEYITEKELYNKLDLESKNRFNFNKNLGKQSEFKYAQYGKVRELKLQADALYKANRNAILYKTQKKKNVLAVYMKNL